MMPPHFGHLTCRPANSSFTERVAGHDGHVMRMGIGPSIAVKSGGDDECVRGRRGADVECIRPFGPMERRKESASRASVMWESRQLAPRVAYSRAFFRFVCCLYCGAG